MTKDIYPLYTQVQENPRTICRELSADVFTYPFFNEGVSKSYTNNSNSYTLDDLEINEAADDLILKGLIFTTSHCGSTLLSGMLSKLPEVRVVSEPEAINGLLLSAVLHQMEADEVILILRKIVRLYSKGARPEKYLVFKLTSWNVFQIELFKQAFPNVKWLFLHREEESLLSSLERSDGGFIDWWEHPVDVLRKHFLPTGKEIQSTRDYLLEMIRGHKHKAVQARDENSLFLEYPGFIENFEEILTHLGIGTGEEDIANALKLLAYDSKTLEKRM
ncbi:MAG: hypothetical protein AAFQ94_15540 [Bacteroidota bacterium]